MLKLIYPLLLLAVISCSPSAKNVKNSDTVPADLLGDFTDDYGIKYTVSKNLWTQHPASKYHLLKYDSKGNYFIAQNDKGNKTDAGLYTRIDVMYFENMAPWKWGFCLTEYKAKTFAEAEAVASADRANPRKGCGGYPFSRMKRKE